MKLYREDLAIANNAMKENIENASAGLKAVSDAVRTFINESDKQDVLEGEDFDRVRKHMEAYCDTLDNATTLLDELPKIVSDANSKMQEYYDENVGWEVPPADEEDIPLAQKCYDIWKETYDKMVADQCTKEDPICDEAYNIIGYSHNGQYHQDQIDFAKKQMDLWQARLRYLLEMRPTDSAAFSKFNGRIDEIIAQTDAKCNDIVVMTIQDSIDKVTQDDSLTPEQKKEKILNSVIYPDWVNDSTSDLSSQTSGYWDQWKAFRIDNFGSESWNASMENYKNDFTGALISDIKEFPQALEDLGAAILGNYK